MNGMALRVAAWVVGLGAAAAVQGQAPFLVRDLTTTPSNLAGSNPDTMTVLGQRVLFLADGESATSTAINPASILLSTDGTPEGTVELKVNAGFVKAGTAPTPSIPVMGGVALFVASPESDAGDLELWATDGTPDGTRLLRPSFGRPTSSMAREITEIEVVSDTLSVFVAHTPEHGWELWRTDGTAAGTVMVRDLHPTASAFAQGIGELMAAGDLVYFAANDGATGAELWRSDGTTAGTRLVADLDPRVDAGTSAPLGSSPVPVAAVGRDVVFRASLPQAGTELYRTFGGGARAAMVHETLTGSASLPTGVHGAVGERVLFTANGAGVGSELWVSEPNADAARLVADLRPGTADSSPEFETRVGDRMLLRYGASSSSLALLSTDGSMENTDVLSPPGEPASVFGDDLLRVVERPGGQILMFASLNSTTGALYRTDGSPRNTHELARFPMSMLQRGGSVRTEAGATLADGASVFFLGDSNNRVDMWRSDGSAEGTRLIMRLPQNAQADWCNATLRGLANGKVFFASPDPTMSGKWHVWSTNGTATGTRLIAPAGMSMVGVQDPTRGFSLMAAGGRVIAAANDGVHGLEPWVFTGEPEGTQLLRNVRRDRTTDSVLIPGREADGQLLVVRRMGGTFGDELWISDGSSEGARRLFVAEASQGPRTRQILDAWGVGGRVMVMVGDSFATPTIWSVPLDGGVAVSIHEAASPQIGAVAGAPVQLRDGRVVFIGLGELDQRKHAWVTDGTPLGTVAIAGLSGLSAASRLDPPVLVDGRALFRVKVEGEPFVSVYRYDGQMLTRLTNIDADPTTADGSIDPTLYAGMAIGPRTMMFDTWPDTGREPVVLNIDTGEVARLDVVAGAGSPVGACTASCSAQPTRVVAGRWMLNIALPESGRELWLSDGTQAGTRVYDLNPGPTSSYPCIAGAIGAWVMCHGERTVDGSTSSRLFAIETASGNAIEITRSDVGCSNGTATPLVSDPQIGGRLLLAMRGTMEAGYEPWLTDGTPAGTRQLVDLYPGSDSGGLWVLAVRRHRAYFVAQQPLSGEAQSVYGVFRSDGTETGTVRRADMPRPVTTTGPTYATVGRRIYFVGNTSDYGTELYALDLPSECLADFDSSGVVTIEDLFAFIAAYLQQRDEADATGEGSVSVEDIFEYLRAYFGGCG